LRIKDVRILERVIHSLFSSIGSLVTVNRIKNTFVSMNTPISNNTLDSYIGAICDAMIMYEAKRYDIQRRALLSTQEKYYVVDVGLRQFLLRDHHEDFGHVIENIVFLELLRRSNKVYIGKTGKYEVDFVAVNPNQEITYYQVALTTLDEKTLERELRSLRSIKDHYQKYLLTLDSVNPTANYDGIKKINIMDWLLNE